MTRTNPPNAQAVSSAGGIDANGIYALRDFQARMHVGRHWMRSARKYGLVVRSHGNRSFVVGADFVEWLSRVEAIEAGGEVMNDRPKPQCPNCTGDELRHECRDRFQCVACLNRCIVEADGSAHDWLDWMQAGGRHQAKRGVRAR